MHRDWLADNEAISDEFADGLARVGIGDFADFVRVEPDLALAAAHDRGGQPLLSLEGDPIDGEVPLVGVHAIGVGFEGMCAACLLMLQNAVDSRPEAQECMHNDSGTYIVTGLYNDLG